MSGNWLTVEERLAPQKVYGQVRLASGHFPKIKILLRNHLYDEGGFFFMKGSRCQVLGKKP